MVTAMLERSIREIKYVYTLQPSNYSSEVYLRETLAQVHTGTETRMFVLTMFSVVAKGGHCHSPRQYE